MGLTFEEFIKLPRSEQNKRERELSDHDRFLARMNDWGPPPGAPFISEEELLANPPKGWEFLTKELLHRMYHDEINNRD